MSTSISTYIYIYVYIVYNDQAPKARSHSWTTNGPSLVRAQRALGEDRAKETENKSWCGLSKVGSIEP